MNGRIASIDFGTNTARLLIADRNDGTSFRHVHLEREIVRMGGGFSREHGLSEDAMQRGRACLKRFAAAIELHGVTTVLAVATSAVRDAVNGPAFVRRVEDETGIALAVIDGVTEAHLTLAGVLAGLDRRDDEMLLFDVGGGSTEYTLVRDGVACFVDSLPLGVVRLTEGKATLEKMAEKIRKELDLLQLRMKAAGCSVRERGTLVGTAGTATTLAAIKMEMADYDYRKVNNTTMTRAEIAAIHARLLALTPEERLLIPGLEKGREDLIIAGGLISLATLDFFGFDTMKVSDYGLLEGLVVAGRIPVPG